MDSKKKYKNIFFKLSALLILAGVVVFYFKSGLAPWLLSIGVAGYAAVVFTTPYPGKSLRGKRLFNIQILAILLMAVSSYLMFVGRMEWVVLLLVAAMLTLYSNFAMGVAYKNEQEDN